MEKNQRRFSNYFLQPLLQVRLGLYSSAIALVFSVMVFITLYASLHDFADVVFAVTDRESEVRSLFRSYITGASGWLLLLLVLFIASNVLVAVIYTHRLIGPTIAFRNHMKKLASGKFQDRIHLRKGDAFQELADELNEFTDLLDRNRGLIPPRD